MYFQQKRLHEGGVDYASIRSIVQDEIKRSNAASQFQLRDVTRHTHNGVDSLRIQQDSIIPSVSVSGAITFAASDTYTIYLNSSFTPSFIIAYGNVVGDGTQLFTSTGTASLTPSFFLQPDTERSVATGNIQYPFIDPNLGVDVPLQSSTYIGCENTSTGGFWHSLASEGHIVNVFYNSEIKARATVTEFSKNFIRFQTTILPGWSMNINYVIK